MEDKQFTSMTITAPADVDMALVTGPADAYVHTVQAAFDADISVRGNRITLEGDAIEVQMITALFSELFTRVSSYEAPDGAEVERLIGLVRSVDFAPSELREDVILTHHGRAVRPRTAGQKRYVDAIRTHTITFAIGPAGTGKTYLACALALRCLNQGEVGRVVLTRPIVEAGESLGYLPGTLMEKVDPYIRPLYDALFDMEERDRVNDAVADGTIEVAPLAFMRGRTLNDSFIILDEAQNTTPEQMKMMLTRLGFGSKLVITGDVTQIDLMGKRSGLIGMDRILGGIDDIAFCSFSESDVVRHSLVAKIISAYDRAEKEAHRGHND
jgi:phosphate starvation-inducible PhoH-like protein